MSQIIWRLAWLSTFLLAAVPFVPAMAQGASVKAVLFYSPTCPHCHEVMQEDLPPLQATYGERLEILEVNVDTPAGQRVYAAYLAKFSVPPERQGVPALVVGDAYMVGSVEIPAQFPQLIEAGLAAGGLDWPVLDSLTSLIGASTVETGPSAAERFAQDPIGNSIALLVLVGMVSSMILVSYAVWSQSVKLSPWPGWVIPALVVVGLIAAGYLTYIEVTQSQALCGPIGDCNAVQTSVYAYVLGGIPIAVLGLVGFIGIGIAGVMSMRLKGRDRASAVTALWWLALAGTGFSIYLTYLEPFVIGATCAWCLTSAVAMTLILWAATPEMIASRRRRGRRGIRKLSTRRA